jgi:D-beta-D-heptose 7-phosphate kinase/D-beta-D-heptose 1-phosphate adenosyltransferase
LLIVGLNADSSVKKLKGNERPIQSQDDRREILLALKAVDAVEVFYEDTPMELIKKSKARYLS